MTRDELLTEMLGDVPLPEIPEEFYILSNISHNRTTDLLNQHRCAVVLATLLWAAKRMCSSCEVRGAPQMSENSIYWVHDGKHVCEAQTVVHAIATLETSEGADK